MPTTVFIRPIIPAIFKFRPLVVTFHGSDALIEPFRNPVFNILQKFVISRADHIIAVSQDIKSKISSDLNGDIQKISVISCGINTKVFTPIDKYQVRKQLGFLNNQKIAIFVGKLQFLKGVDIIYQAAEIMMDIIFVNIGGGELKCDLPNCIFPGPVSNDKLPLWLNAADIFVLPSRTEGTPVVILEAMSCGLPIISSPVGGCKDLVIDGQNGYLLNMEKLLLDFKEDQHLPGNESEHVNWAAKDLAQKIGLLFEDDAMRNTMAAKSRAMAVADYDHKIIARKIKKVYKKLSTDSR